MKYDYIFVSDEIPRLIETRLSEITDGLIKLDANPYLPKQVSKHADMQLLCMCHRLVLTHELYEKLKLPDNIIISLAETNHSDKYPRDVNLNALLLDNHLLCKADAIDQTVFELCRNNGIKIVNIKQGYAKCSALVINNNAVISADTGLIEAASLLGYDTLLIKAGYIVLNGYDYGFIGGASFYDKFNHTVYFFGDITKHPSYGEIKSFCEKHSTDIVSISDTPLTDLGGAVAI